MYRLSDIFDAMPATEAFKSAIDRLGGPLAAAAKLKRRQPTISGYLKDGNAPADVCMRLEIETGGEFLAEHMRPDLADVFKEFRQTPPKPRKRAA